jgi:transposase-like protein
LPRLTEILVMKSSMGKPDRTGNVASIADLQINWDQFNDVDRARAVHQFHQSGVSLRELAKALNCSASLLRQLDQAPQAPPLDQMLARRGEISTRELVRRSRAAKLQCAAKERQADERKRMQAAQQGSKTICDWLEEEKLWPSHGEAIVDETRMILFQAEQHGTLPQGPPPPPGTPVKEIIRRCRPKPETVESSDVARYAHWLAVWAYYSFPDTMVRDRALNLALDRLSRQ